MAGGTEISLSEWQVMNAVWDGQPITAREIINLVGPANDWTPATVRTFLHRLVKKGALKTEEDGNRYLYSSAIPKSKTIKQASRSFLASVFSGETGPLLTHFVKTSQLSPEEIQQLRDLLEAQEDRQ
ncbi:MAG: BlaI/MecI/CopY family transcriptional regulator [Mariniblastus sp.]